MAEIGWRAEPVWDWRRMANAGGGAAGQRAREVRLARQQGAIGFAVGLAVAAVLAYLFHRRGAALVVAGVSTLVLVIALAAPLTLYPKLRQAVDLLGHWIATAVTWLLMTVLFYLLFLPVGLVMRMAGKLPLRRFAEPALATYWISTETRPRSAGSYRKQF